jgi:hypothetical protein
MAITTYTELQTAIADYLARSDLNSRIPDFIALAEARMNRFLRARDMETSATVTMTSGSGPLPGNYLEWIEVTHDGSTHDPVLRYVEPDSEEWRFRYRPNGDPTMFTILAGDLRIKPVVSGNCNLVYYRTIQPLSSNATNWLLTRAPDLYVNYALAEAYIFTKDLVKAKDFMTLAEGETNKATQDGDSNKQARRPHRIADIEDISAARNPATDGL